MDSLGGNRCIDLCCSQVGMSEHTAHCLYRHASRERNKRSKGVSCHVKGQRRLHADVSLYVVHAVVDDVSSRHVKDKTCTLSSVPLHNRPSRRKYLHTVWGLGLHSPALDAEFALFQDDVFLPKITDIRNCKP